MQVGMGQEDCPRRNFALEALWGWSFTFCLIYLKKKKKLARRIECSNEHVFPVVKIKKSERQSKSCTNNNK